MEKSFFPMFEKNNQYELNEEKGGRKDMQFKEIKEREKEEKERKIRERREKERRENEGFCCECCMRNFGIGKYKFFPHTPYKGYSIVEGLKYIGVDSYFGYRCKIAEKNGINYTGTPEQNLHMLNLLKKGELLKP